MRQNFPPITKLPSIQPTEFKIRKYAYPPALEPGVTAKIKIIKIIKKNKKLGNMAVQEAKRKTVRAS